MSDWVYLNHPDTDAEPARVPDEPDVVAFYEARGWQKVDPPEAGIFVPQPSASPADVDASGVAWVTLQHDKTGALHRFPADAADGLRDDGWYPVDGPDIKAGQLIGWTASSGNAGPGHTSHEDILTESKPATVDNDDTPKE